MTELRWLDDLEMSAWRGLNETCSRLLERLEAELKAESGLTFADYEVLVNLSESPDLRLRMSDLAEQIVHSRSRLTARIDRMQERGLVERHPADDDRRVTYAVITDQGMKSLAAAAPGHLASVREHLVSKLDRDDIAALARIMPKISGPLRP